ncbi:MAG: condensation domain-containing protein, partial [Chloroflexi bacterium]|nr:condensation domain-containing protein [Chloroflexota bacterium]
MSKRNIESVYPLSPMQQGMLFHSLYNPDSGVYVEQMTCVFEGELDVPSFARAWQQVVNRHTILRTAFAWKRVDRMLQVVHRETNMPLQQHDWSRLSPSEQAAQLEAFLQADRSHSFDVSKAPLMRLALMRLGANQWQFAWTHHHILLDGWSVPILLREVLTLYEAYRLGREATLPPTRPYRDYIAWLDQQDLSQAESFWRKALQGFTAPTPLTVDRPASSAAGVAPYPELDIELPTQTTAALHAMSREHQLTMNTLVQGAWALLLSRYSGEEDILFGATVSGRPAHLPGAESMVGLFINTLPVRVALPPHARLIPWLQQLQAQQAQLRQYEH